jgi:hypothetical protein
MEYGISMSMFKIENELFIPLNKEEIESEEQLEKWLEKNCDHLLEKEQLLVIGKQVKTEYNHYPDLLALDKMGNLVVIELKRGKTPRDVVAQALEYAAWAAKLSPEEISEIASNYLANSVSLIELLKDKFHIDEEFESISINPRQRIIIVSERIDPVVEDVIRLLRRNGLDIIYVRFGFFKSKAEEFIELETLIGREEPGPPRPPLPKHSPFYDFFITFEEKLRSEIDKNFIKFGASKSFSDWSKWLWFTEKSGFNYFLIRFKKDPSSLEIGYYTTDENDIAFLKDNEEKIKREFKMPITFSKIGEKTFGIYHRKEIDPERKIDLDRDEDDDLLEFAVNTMKSLIEIIQPILTEKVPEKYPRTK